MTTKYLSEQDQQAARRQSIRQRSWGKVSARQEQHRRQSIRSRSNDDKAFVEKEHKQPSIHYEPKHYNYTKRPSWTDQSKERVESHAVTTQL
jgi:hypothetical protein